MAEITYQQRNKHQGCDDTSLSQRRTSGRVLEDNRAAFMTGGITAQLVARDNFKKEQRAKILAKNKKKYGLYTCEHCGFQHGQIHYATYRGKRTGDGGFQVDHVTPASKGGRALVGNSRVLCGTCNTSRGNRAGPKRLGIHKYKGIHKGKITKDYKIKRRNY